MTIQDVEKLYEAKFAECGGDDIKRDGGFTDNVNRLIERLRDYWAEYKKADDHKSRGLYLLSHFTIAKHGYGIELPTT